MSKYYYPALFMIEEVGYSVIVPDLPGCFTQGDTIEEAAEMAKEAMGLYLEDTPEEEYAKPSKPQDIELEDNQFVMMVEFDKIAYDKKFNSKAVKKTLTIPMWLNTLAEKNHINFSSILQSALKAHLGVE